MIHIVRRYGLVGGMEGYVWELTHALATLGVSVEVICEQLYGRPSPDIQVHIVTPERVSPRWRAMLGFRASVDELIKKQFTDRKIVIHSHERSINHHITTFHGPPMQVKTDWWRFSWLSARIKAWKFMEREEILGSQVQLVLPVSKRIQQELISLYPELKNKKLVVSYPGVHIYPHKTNPQIKCSNKTEGKFVFVGKEWKRKGLKFAIDLVNYYYARFEKCTIDIYGPTANELPGSFRNHPNVRIRGWCEKIPWHQYDALIHPAKNEPFGMVVPEARRHGIPVLTTNLVGSIELDYSGVIALDSSESIGIWAESLFKLTLDRNNRKFEIKWTWQNLAIQHLTEIYPLVNVDQARNFQL